MKPIKTIARWSGLTLLANVALVAGALRAQGVSYDISSTVTGTNATTGKASTTEVMSAHAQFAGGDARADITRSSAIAGFMSPGTYTITSASKNTSTMVNPAKRQYTLVKLGEVGAAANGAQSSMAGLAKEEMTDVKVTVRDLGPGEAIAGYSTHKYRLSESSIMKLTTLGHSIDTPSRSTTDIWVATALDASMDPGSHPGVGIPTGMTAELTRQLNAAYATIGKGLWIKRITTEADDDGRGGTTMTTLITNVKRAAVSPSVFEVPAGYKKVTFMEALQASDPDAQQGRPE